ncbi:MAG: methyl-accepting chemotaxis protein [Candidatus Brocadiaceae bacterium]
MVNRYELTGLNKITTDREGMGQTGEVYIVGKDGYMITQSRFVDDAILKQRVDTEPVKLFHKQKKNTTGIYPDYRGIPVVGASMGDELEEEFGLGWVIMAEVDSVEAFAPAKTIGLRILWTGTGAGIVVAIIAYFVARRIANPMVRISDQIARVGDGDLTVQIPYNYRRDEVGILAKTLVRMVAGLRDVTRGIMEGECPEFYRQRNTCINLAQVASSSSETATAVSQTTTTVEEVKQTTQVSVQKATNVSDKAQKTLQISQTGKKSVEDTINGMHRILEQMAAISESIERLSEQRQAIGEIVATVDDLAEQTNLLSVNASIEAAKAGEEGKGFAVVAQEIRHLAELSKQATTQVRNILNNIQKSTSTAVMATEQGSKAVEQG